MDVLRNSRPLGSRLLWVEERLDTKPRWQFPNPSSWPQRPKRVRSFVAPQILMVKRTPLPHLLLLLILIIVPQHDTQAVTQHFAANILMSFENGRNNSKLDGKVSGLNGRVGWQLTSGPNCQSYIRFSELLSNLMHKLSECTLLILIILKSTIL